MAVPFMLGSFVSGQGGGGGLFGGAQTAIGLYNALNAISSDYDTRQKLAQAHADQERLDKAGPPSFAPAVKYDRATGDWVPVPAPAPAPAPVPVPASGTTNGPVSPAPAGAPAGAPATGGTPAAPATLPPGYGSNDASASARGADTATAQAAASSDAYRPQLTGIPQPQQPLQPPFERRWWGGLRPTGNPIYEYPNPNQASTGGDLAQPPAVPYPSPNQVSTATPAPSALQRPSAITNRPVGSTITSPFTSYTPQEPVPGARGPAMAPTPPPFNAAGVPGPAGSPSGPPAPYNPTQPVTAPIPASRPGPPVIPPPQGSGIGGSVQGGVPQAQAQPPSTLGRVLSAFNPIGTAQAAEGKGGLPPAQQDTGSAGAAPSPATVAAQAQPAPVTTAAPPAQPQGVTTATPPKAATETKAGPVQTPAKVTSDQPGPSVQSQSEPAGVAPPISPRAWIDGTQNHKEIADLIPGLVESNGGYPGMTLQIAATIRRESGWDPKAHAKGAMGQGMGLMQIEPATWRMFDPDNRLDPYKAEDNIKVGIEYYKYLAKDFGAGTFQQNLAYMRGPGGVIAAQHVGWPAYAQTNDIAAKGVLGMYDDKVNPTPAMFSYDSSRKLSAPGIIQAGQGPNGSLNPDGVLNYITNYGPVGVPLADSWRAAQYALEDHMIVIGHPEMIPHAMEWIAQVSHQGAVSNLIAGDQALLRGDMQGAANAFAKSHAFFPDGTYARIGVDQSNHLWATQYSEGYNTQLGKPFQITHEMVAQQIIGMQNPVTYVQTMQTMQKSAAEIEQMKAHAQYYRSKPEEQEAIANARIASAQGIAANKIEATATQNELNRKHQEEMQQERLEAQARVKAEQDKSTAAIDKDVAANFGPDVAVPEGVKPEAWSSQSEVYRQLRIPEGQGGGGLGDPAARAMSENLRTGRYKLHQKGDAGYAIVDEKGKTVRGLNKDNGDKLVGLPGILGSQPLDQTQQPGPQKQTSAVGIGAGSPSAMQMGYNQSLSGITPAHMPPRQSAPQSMVA